MYIYWLKKSLISKNSLLVCDSWWRVQCDVSILRTTTHQKSISHTQFWSSQNTCSLLITIKTVHLSRIKNIFRVKQHFRSAATTFTHNPPEKCLQNGAAFYAARIQVLHVVFFSLFFFQHMLRYTRGFLTSIPLRASTSYGTRNFTANSTIRQVVPFSRTAKMALSGLLDSPDRFSPSCSASTTDSASTPDQGRGNKGVTDGVGGQGGTHTHDLTHTHTHDHTSAETCRISRNGCLMISFWVWRRVPHMF